jgi:monoamine oxidase
MARDEATPLDLAIVGGGTAGSFVAHAVKAARPDWTIELLERTQRIGGRLRSMVVPGADHPIELGGMRLLTSHRRMVSVVEQFGIATRTFDTIGAPERSFLRGRFGSGPNDPDAGAGYDLAPGERGRAALDLMRIAFDRIIPGAERLDAPGWARARASGRFNGRAVTDWSIEDAFDAVLSREGHRFVVDSFGYDSGMRPFNVGDAIEYVTGGGDPTAEARVPVDGMDRIPGSLVAAFDALGGQVRLGREVVAIQPLEPIDAGTRLQLDDGAQVDARRVVLATAIPALRLLAEASPVLGGRAFRQVIDAIEGFPSVKLYLWYERPWWRPAIPGIRLTTDLTTRKLFYFDAAPGTPSVLLGTYTDGRHTEPWSRLSDGVSDGRPAPEAVLAALTAQLQAIHPQAGPIPAPLGSAFQHWGSDPHETGWPFWLPGVNSDELIAVALQPDPALRIYLCGDSFSRAQGWAEGALETAEAVVSRLLASGT